MTTCSPFFKVARKTVSFVAAGTGAASTLDAHANLARTPASARIKGRRCRDQMLCLGADVAGCRLKVAGWFATSNGIGFIVIGLIA
jgi:hypothetical protein